jgi:vancomycin permeability regulator SanA
MKKIKRNNINYFLSVISVLIILAHLLVIFFVKYKIHNLPIGNFRLGYLGNLLNLSISLLIIIGLIINMFLKSNVSDRAILSYIVVMTLFLLAGIINSFFRFPMPKLYMFEHQFRDVLTGFLFSAYQFVNFILLFVVWLNITGRKGLLFLNASLDAVILIILFLIFAFIYVNLNITVGKLNNTRNNIAVVLGAAVWSNNNPSPMLASRSEKAYELYKQGYINKIQLTGGNAPGELSEAEVASLYLKQRGVNMNDIWIENKTSNTAEQVRFVKEELINKKRLTNIIFISNSYHLTRINEICSFYNVNAGIEASNLDLSFDSNIYYKVRESIALLVFWFFAL